MAIKVDKTKCVGCGMCVGLCPEVFGMGSDNKSEVIGDDENCAKNAVASCPVSAINIE